MQQISLEVDWILCSQPFNYETIQLRSNTPTGPGEIIESTATNSIGNDNTGLSVFGHPIYHTKIDHFHTLEATGGSYAYWLSTNQT